MELPSARPYVYRFRPESTALIIIDMQRDFLDFNGFGMIQCGNDEIFQKVREIVPRTQRALEVARAMGLHVIHTREGHKPDLSDWLIGSSLKRKIMACVCSYETRGSGTVRFASQAHNCGLLVVSPPSLRRQLVASDESSLPDPRALPRWNGFPANVKVLSEFRKH